MIVAFIGLICNEGVGIGLFSWDWLGGGSFLSWFGVQLDSKKLALSAPSSGEWIGELTRLRKLELSANVQRASKKRIIVIWVLMNGMTINQQHMKVPKGLAKGSPSVLYWSSFLDLPLRISDCLQEQTKLPLGHVSEVCALISGVQPGWLPRCVGYWLNLEPYLFLILFDKRRLLARCWGHFSILPNITFAVLVQDNHDFFQKPKTNENFTLYLFRSTIKSGLSTCG